MWSSNKVYMKTSIKHATMTPSLLRLFPTAELTDRSLDAAFAAERWPTTRSMEPRGYLQLHCRADQPVAWCSLVAISGSHPMMRISPAWVVTDIKGQKVTRSSNVDWEGIEAPRRDESLESCEGVSIMVRTMIQPQMNVNESLTNG